MFSGDLEIQTNFTQIGPTFSLGVDVLHFGGGSHHRRIHNQVWCIMGHATQQVRDTLSHVQLGVTQSRKQLRNYSYQKYKIQCT